MAEIYSDDEYAEFNLNEESSLASFDSDKVTPQYHIQQAEMALQNLKFVVKEQGWKKILQHKGTSVYSKIGITADDKLPVFMGEYVIEGFTPRAIFAVIGMRKLWDDWYEEGSLIENLNETTSLTYMVIQALAGSKARDLSLVEKIECAQNGTIYFTATSVETPKVPRVSNKIRAHLNLNGWILEPLSHNPTRTKVTYVLQTRIKGWVPSIVSKSYLARRPLVLHTIDQYLQKNGPLPMVISNTPSEPSRAQSDSDTSSTYQDNIIQNNNLDFTKVKYPRTKISFTNLNESLAKQHDDYVAPVFPIQTNGKIQNGFLPELVSSSLSSPTPPSPTMITEKSSSSILSQQRSFVKSIQHRHTASVQRALEIFKSHVPLGGWDFHSESKNVKIYMKEIAGKSTPIMRGDSVIFGGFTTYDILSVIKSLDTRKLWDERYDEGATYEMFGLHEHLTRTAMKGTFPISGRDFSVCSTLDHDEGTGTLQFVSTSVVDPLIPESKKHVRGHLESAGWQLKPHFDSGGKTTSVEVVYIVDIDIKLDTVPSSIRKTLSVQIPMNVAKIDELMQIKGYSPYVLNSTTKIIKEEYSLNNDQYDISLIAKDGGVTELKLSKLMYPNGVEVSTVPENCKVQFLPNSTDVIRITLPPRVDLDTLIITISKHSKGFQMTYNHGQIIPTASNSPKPKIENPAEIRQNISTRPKHLSHNTNVTTSTNGIIKINHEADNVTNNDKSNARHSRKYKKLSSPVSRNTVTSKTFVNPSEVSLKSEPYQRMLEKQTLLENKIAAVTRASRTDLALLEVNAEIEESQASRNVLEVKPKTEEYRASRNDLALLEVNAKIEEYRASRNDLTLLEVNAKIEEYRASRNDLTLLEVKPKIEDSRASRNDLTLLEVKPKIEEYRASRNDLTHLEAKPKIKSRASRNDLTLLEVKPKIEDSRASRNDSTLLEAKPKIKSRASRNDLTLLEVKPKTEDSRESRNDSTLLEAKPKIKSRASRNDLTLLEVKPKIKSRASRNDLAPLKVKPKIEESQASRNVLEVKPKIEDSRISHDDLAPLEVKLKTEESRASHDALEVKPKTEVEKPKNEVIEGNINNINNTITLNDTQNMIVITDSIRFNSHQIGLMFASMLLAYYAGKLST